MIIKNILIFILIYYMIFVLYVLISAMIDELTDNEKLKFNERILKYFIEYIKCTAYMIAIFAPVAIITFLLHIL